MAQWRGVPPRSERLHYTTMPIQRDKISAPTLRELAVCLTYQPFPNIIKHKRKTFIFELRSWHASPPLHPYSPIYRAGSISHQRQAFTDGPGDSQVPGDLNQRSNWKPGGQASVSLCRSTHESCFYFLSPHSRLQPSQKATLAVALGELCADKFSALVSSSWVILITQSSVVLWDRLSFFLTLSPFSSSISCWFSYLPGQAFHMLFTKFSLSSIWILNVKNSQGHPGPPSLLSCVFSWLHNPSSDLCQLYAGECQIALPLHLSPEFRFTSSFILNIPTCVSGN